MSDLRSQRAKLLAKRLSEAQPLCEIVGCLRPMFCWIDGRATCIGHTEILIDRWNAAAINADAIEHLVPLLYRQMESFLEWERKQNAVAFTRTETRCTRLKRRLDCGHVIDGSQPYRYHVFKLNSDTSLNQRTDCEVCARADVSY